MDLDQVFEGLKSFVNSNALSGFVGGVIGSVIGVWGGYKLNFGLAKRAEYNEIADKLFLYFDGTLEPPAHQRNFPYNDIKLIRRRMNRSQRAKFDHAFEKLENANAKIEYDDYGQPYLTDIESVNQCYRELCEILHRK